MLTLLSDDWRVAGFDAGVLVCSLIMPQIISMEQRENTDYVFPVRWMFLYIVNTQGRPVCLLSRSFSMLKNERICVSRCRLSILRVLIEKR